jgi:hypothetical protein
MSILCKLCNTEFEKIIPWQHLKTHDVTSAEYKLAHGPLYSEETLLKFSTRVPHNKGTTVTDPEHLAVLRAGVALREEKYKNGLLTRAIHRTLTEEERKNLSEKTKEYAKTHANEMKARGTKAVVTKLERGYDFGKNMRGKIVSDETRDLIRKLALARVQQKTIVSHAAILEKISQLDLVLHSDIHDTQLDLECTHCATRFLFTKQYFTPSKFKKSLCPTCWPRHVRTSKGESDIFEFIKNICPDAISNYRSHYHAKEIDVFVPSLNIGIEFNGLYWHSEPVLLANNKSPRSDREKQEHFSNQGIRIINIYEDEWGNKSDIVKSRLQNILGVTGTTIYARKCQVREVSSKDAAAFCNANHLMGKGRSNIRLGLYYEDKMVSVMTFSNNNLSRKAIIWEINRFASLLNVNVVGGASRLFKTFIRQHKPDQVLSYADNRWSAGNLYRQLGFTKINDGTPNYWYLKTNLLQRIHRFTLRKTRADDVNLTEYENRELQGYTRIWDCGSSKWMWDQHSILVDI